MPRTWIQSVLRAYQGRIPRNGYGACCAEALMINDRWQDAIDLHAKRRYDPMSFQILCEQSRFEDAFALISLDNPRTKATDWFAETAKDFDPSDPFGPPRAFGVSFQVAKALDFLGERQQSTALLKAIAALSDEGKGWWTKNLLATEIDLGMHHLAFQHADAALQKTEMRDTVYQSLFFRQVPIAKSLDEWFPPSKDLDAAKLFQLFRPRQDEIMEKAQLREIVEQCIKRVITAADDDPSGGKMSQAATMRTLGELALIHRQSEIARDCFEKLQTLEPSAATAMQIADLFAKEGNWTAAASNYDSVWQMDPTDPLPLYLCGHALIQVGEVEKGQQKIELAKLLPLANSERRKLLATGLAQRGFREEVLDQWEFILKFGGLEYWEGSQAWAVGDAAANIAQRSLKSDPLRAAWLLERQVFYLLKTNASFMSITQYVMSMALIHSTRAQGLLRDGRVDEALAEIELSLNARIDQVDAIIDFVHGLEENDRAADAQQVFHKVANRFKELLRLFPNCSHFHNNLAWLMACCDRELDLALVHATEATRLAPANVNYLDTLAEVHFRKGDRDQAAEVIQSALLIDPDSAHLQKQLERFSRVQEVLDNRR